MLDYTINNWKELHNVKTDDPPYLCEILFDDWNKIEKLIYDDNILILYCKEVFPNGVWDKRKRTSLIVESDSKEYKFPVVRLIFLTTSYNMYLNFQKTLHITYKDKLWFTYTYDTLKLSSFSVLSYCDWFSHFKKYAEYIQFNLNCDDISNEELHWKYLEREMLFRDIQNH